MALVLTIALVVVLVALRLFVPPVPGLLKMSLQRWGKRITVMLFATSLIGAVLAIVVLRR
ncbi:MAG: hypothetical protein JO210_17945 [Acidobacteriaceae bacterium]|nr:hypothetical protein [Acidobacteriaceae bacterium]